MRVGIGQINTWAGDVGRNLTAVKRVIDQAKSAACDVVVFPEYAVPGAFPLDLIRQAEFLAACGEADAVIEEASKGIAVLWGSVARTHAHPHELHDSALLAADGSLILQADRTKLRCWPFDEASRFAPGQGARVADLQGRIVGLALQDLDDIAEEELDLYAGLGAEWLFFVSSTPFRGAAGERRLVSAREAAAAAGVGLVFVNGVGGADGIVLEGGSFVVSPEGNLIFEAPRFEEGFYIIDLGEPAAGAVEPAKLPKSDRIASMRSAIVIAIRDYVRKSGHGSVVIGISGGIDSALVAALAVDALGPDAVRGVYLPCAHSSEASRRDAHELAARLGFGLRDVAASSVHDALRNALPFTPEGIVDENLQARARAVLWMAIANERHALVLTTGNKSEAAVGYATLYGDTTGALAPIVDLYKTDVYRMAETFGDAIPREILEKAPSAELRPEQRDSDELPPYDELDRLLRAYVDEGASREELLASHAPGVVDDVLRRFQRSEFKRRQGPPAVLVSESPLSRRQLPLSRDLPSPTAPK